MTASYRTAFVLLGSLATAAGALSAQVPAGRRELVGIVKDQRGVGVEGAIVEITGAGTRTNPMGAFRLFTGDVDTVTIAIRRPGYAPIEALISATNRQWDTLSVELEQLTTLLPGVRIEEERTLRAGLRSFEERVAAKASGMFITRDDIVSRNPSRLSDVLQARRGVQLLRIGSNRYGVRFATYSGTRGRACAPDMWVDGMRARGMELDDLSPNTVEGIELYDSFALVPFEFAHGVNAVPCGTIVVWTRPPGTKRP